MVFLEWEGYFLRSKVLDRSLTYALGIVLILHSSVTWREGIVRRGTLLWFWVGKGQVYFILTFFFLNIETVNLYNSDRLKHDKLLLLQL